MWGDKMMSTSRTISEWTRIFDGIYGLVNAHRPPEQMWLSVMAHCSAVGEGIRTAHYTDVLREAAHAFEWMCAFVSKMNALEDSDIFAFRATFSEMVAFKYPERCGHCAAVPCRCNPKQLEEIKDKAGRYEILSELWRQKRDSWNNYTLERWKNVFNEIYSQNIHLLSLEMIGFHFLEEAGEAAHAVKLLSEMRGVLETNASRELRQFIKDNLTQIDDLFCLSTNEEYKAVIKGIETVVPYSTSKKIDDIKKRLFYAKLHLITEFADTFAWMCSLLNKIETVASNNNATIKTIEDMIVHEYFPNGEKGVCPYCKESPCECAFFMTHQLWS